MTPRLAECIEAGRALDPDEREIAVLALQQIEETDQADINDAWDETIAIARARAATLRK